MISILFGLFLICSCLSNQASTSLISCPTTTTATSIRYSMTLSSPGIASYWGTLLLSPTENFISLITIPDAGSPQNAIQGTWSLSDCGNVLTLNAHTFYFLDLLKFYINNLTCTYTCGSDNNVLRACTATYTLKSLKATGTYSFTLDLSIPE
jgi:hypothetical protein